MNKKELSPEEKLIGTTWDQDGHSKWTFREDGVVETIGPHGTHKNIWSVDKKGLHLSYGAGKKLSAVIFPLPVKEDGWKATDYKGRPTVFNLEK